MADSEIIRVEGAKRIRLHTGRMATVIIKKDKKLDIVFDFEYEEESADDTATLKSTDGAYTSTVNFSDGVKTGTLVQLTFKDIQLDKDYDLSVDPGASGSVYNVFKNEKIDKSVLEKKNEVLIGRFWDKETEKPLRSHFVYVDTPGDDKVVVENEFKTSMLNALGGRFIPGREYNFFISEKKIPTADIEKKGEGDLQKLTATAPFKKSCLFKLSVVALPELAQIVVMDGLPITDAKPPHCVWDSKEKKATAEAPSLILHNTKLKLKATLRGGGGSGKAKLLCELKEKNSGDTMQLEAELDRGKLGDQLEVELESPENFTEIVRVNELQGTWSLEADGQKKEIAKDVPLRIYTTHKDPIKNTQYDSHLQHVCKTHLEFACRWANGASKNIGDGEESIPYQVDNQLRHYVHPSEFGGNPEYAPVYESGDPKPKNYDDLPGWVSNGRRSVSSLYYPPLEPKEEYEKYYPHYQNNFGWRLLDNKEHTGGRCNQQASLICEVFGVLGIKASLYYLQRVGFGKQTGRPVRQFFNCYSGGTYWNFHGIVKCEMDDKSFHMYDGSFSSPPRRKHGSEKWAIGERGPFIYSWEKFWKYQDHDLSAFFHNKVMTETYKKLDTAFPEFGWKGGPGSWECTNASFAKSTWDVEPTEVKATRTGFDVKGESYHWLAWISSGKKNKFPEGKASMKAAEKLCTLVGIDPDELKGAVPKSDEPDTWDGVPKAD